MPSRSSRSRWSQLPTRSTERERFRTRQRWRPPPTHGAEQYRFMVRRLGTRACAHALIAGMITTGPGSASPERGSGARKLLIYQDERRAGSTDPDACRQFKSPQPDDVAPDERRCDTPRDLLKGQLPTCWALLERPGPGMGSQLRSAAPDHVGRRHDRLHRRHVNVVVCPAPPSLDVLAVLPGAALDSAGATTKVAVGTGNATSMGLSSESYT